MHVSTFFESYLIFVTKININTRDFAPKSVKTSLPHGFSILTFFNIFVKFWYNIVAKM